MKRIYVIMIVAMLLIGCKTHSVISSQLRDSVRVEYRLDSVYLYERDSIYVDRWRSNDTVYLTTEKWLTRYKDKIVQVHDTITMTKSETIVQTERYVPKFYKWCTGLFFALLILILGIIALRIYLKR